MNACLYGCVCTTDSIHDARLIFVFVFSLNITVSSRGTQWTREKCWLQKKTDLKSENIYVIFIQVRHYMLKNNLICASDAVTYAVFTELKCESSSIVSCTYLCIFGIM